MTDAGMIVVTSVDEADDHDLEMLKLLNHPNEILVINMGGKTTSKFPIDLEIPADAPSEHALDQAMRLLTTEEIIPSYCI